MFEFHVQVTEKDYQEFNRYHLTHSKSGKHQINVHRFLLTGIYAGLGVLSLCLSGKTNHFLLIFGILLLLLAILWGLFSPKLLVNSALRSVKKSIHDGKLPFTQQGALIFTEKELTESDDCGEHRTKYEDIEKIAVDQQMYYIYISSIQAYLLPFHAFTDETQRKSFIAFMTDKIGSEKIQ